MHRRDVCLWIALAASLAPAAGQAQAGPDAELSLYGLKLRNALRRSSVARA